MKRAAGINERNTPAPMELSMRDILTLKDDRLCGRYTETLINVPEQGVLTPASYQDIANRSKLSADLAEWTIKQLARLPEEFRALMGDAFVTVYVPYRMLKTEQLTKLLEDMQRLHSLPVESLVLQLSPEILYEEAPEVAERMYSLSEKFGLRFMLGDFGGEFCPALRLSYFNFAYVMLDITAGKNTAEAAKIAADCGAEVILGSRGAAQYDPQAEMYLAARRVIAPDGRYCDG